MSKQKLSNVDAAWLHMEDPTNLMMINGFYQFNEPLDFERVRVTLQQRFLRFDRFTQVVVEPRMPLRAPYWKTDPNFDIDAHLHRIALPEPGDSEMLRELVSDLASTPLDYSKPLWQIHVIENYQGGALLYCRLHHCIADGIALMHVMLSMCDEDPDAPWPEPEPEKARHRHFRLARALWPVTKSVASTLSTTGSMVGSGLDMFLHPSHAMAMSKNMAREAGGFAARLGRLTFLPPDPKTIFKGELGVSKRVAWSEPLPVPEVKQVGMVMGGTINDVLLSTVTGALRRYLLDKHQPVDGIEIRAMVPVNLRSPEDAFKLGNHFGLVVLALPIRFGNPLERLLEIKHRMDDLKNSSEAIVGYTILQMMGLAPGEIERLGVEFFASKASAVMTNVPGPRKKLYFAGNKIDNVMFWVPQSGRMALGVSIFSYAGNVLLGVITDAGVVPDPELIIAEFQNEFRDLQARVSEIEALTYKGDVKIVDDSERGRCKAITKAGTRCKNRTMAGSAYCHVHAKIIGDSGDVARLS